MKFPVLSFIFLGLFLVASVIQLIFAFLEKENFRRKEKPFCLLTLALFAFFAFPDKPLIYIGALFGMLGDILDLEPKTFALGATCFYVGHICYLFEIVWDVFQFTLPAYIYFVMLGANIIVFATMLIACVKFSSHSRFDSFGQSAYFAILITYLPLLICAISIAKNLLILCLIGAFLFIVSDSILVKTHFGKKFKKYNFFIMLTYLLAEASIVLGFVLLFAI